MLSKRRSKPMLGLDVSTSSVKVIELSQTKAGYRVDHYAAEPMPQNSISDKVIVDIDAAGDAVRKAVKRSGTRCKQAAVAIGGASVITKIISLPASLSGKELEEQVELQADQYIPFPLEEVSYDFEVQGPSEADPDMVDIFIAATRTENVEHRQAVLEAANLQAAVVDIESDALENACGLLTHQMPDNGLDKSIAVVDFGATTTTFSILYDRKVAYTRDQAFGGRQLTEEIMRAYGLSFEEAGKAKKEGGLPGNYEGEILEPFVDDMAQQINRSLQFYLSSTSGQGHLDQIIVCGGCAAIPGVDQMIQERLDVPTVIGNPFGEMKLSSRARAQDVEKDAPALMIACGLALRSFD
ncbi:type IV pilus assembly protein PilM [Natronospira proteinivora]|uniref:Type IV pilus assembly protein PilM n=2 Tax=Natronospira proteinivora TaxID=1807133 RepID=A0ABT1G9K6_9GAMM|nr:type IV pilus assembly protein PilM [Natronospira proteinivora]